MTSKAGWSLALVALVGSCKTMQNTASPSAEPPPSSTPTAPTTPPPPPTAATQPAGSDGNATMGRSAVATEMDALLATVFGAKSAEGRVIDARRCEGAVCEAAAIVLDTRGDAPAIGLLVLPRKSAKGAKAGKPQWLDLSPGDSARWHAAVDLDPGAFAADPARVLRTQPRDVVDRLLEVYDAPRCSPTSSRRCGYESTRDLPGLAQDTSLRFPDGAKAPALVVTIGTDQGVGQAVVVALHRGGAFQRVLFAAVRGKDASGRGFSPIGRGFRLLKGKGPLLDFGWIEHVTPAPGDVPFRPGPPLHVRMRYDGKAYTRSR